MAEPVRPAAGKDVAAPGTTPASPTSKPIIVGHSSSQMGDPMVKSDPVQTVEELPSGEKPAVPENPSVSMGSSKPKLTPSIMAQEAQAAAEKTGIVTEESESAEAKAEEERQARVQELVESGEYHVSIGQKHTKTSIGIFLITILVIILVGVVVLFVLTDLKIIDVGIKLPFHIFKQ